MSDTTVSPKLVQFTSKAADFVNHALCPHLYPHTCTLSFINASPRGHSHHSVQFPIIGKYDVREGFSDHGGRALRGSPPSYREGQEDCMFYEIST